MSTVTDQEHIAASPEARRSEPVPGPQVPMPEEAPRAAAADFARTRERFVLFMMLIVAAAVTGMTRVHFGFSMVAAFTAGFISWALFMTWHLVVKRSAELGRLRSEIARLEQEVSSLRPAGQPAATVPGRSRVSADKTGPIPGGAADAASPPDAAGGAASRASHQAPRGPSAQGPAAPAADGDHPYKHAPIATEARWEPAQPARQPAKFVLPPGGAARGDSPPQDNARPTAAAPDSGQADGRKSQTPAAARQAEQPAPETIQPQLSDMPSWSGTSLSTADPLREAWSFRPRTTADALPFTADGELAEAGSGPVPARPIEADLELVQRKIRALADEVNAAEALKQPGPSNPSRQHANANADSIDKSVSALRAAAGAMSPYRNASAQSKPAQRQTETRPKAESPATPGAAKPGSSLALPSLDTLIPKTAETIAASCGEAKNTDVAQPGPQGSEKPSQPVKAAAPSPPPANAASAGSATPPHTAPPKSAASAASAASAPPSASPPPPAAMPQQRRPAHSKRIEDIATAIQHGRMDVFLNPIVGLGDFAVTHFEVTVRLRTPGGGFFERPEQVLSLGATDILALFDVERLHRTAAVAEQLEARGKKGSVLSSTSGSSISDTTFLDAFVQTYENRVSISNQLVLAFTQADVAAFGPGTWRALEDMNSFGFRFALEHVTHLGTDFAKLADQGFSFVKLPAEAFLAGMAAEGSFVPAADICRHIAGAGLALVVEGVHDEDTLGRVFGFGALLGQGQLFGGGRQINLETLPPAQTAA